MRYALTSLLLIALAAPLFAGDAEQANTKKFLDAQAAVDAAALGEQTLKVRILGAAVGTMTLKVEAGEFEGTKCYVLTMKGEIDMGVKTTINGTAHIAPNMAVLHAEQTETEGDKISEHTLYTVKDGVITAKFERPRDKDETRRSNTYEIKAASGLLLGGGEMLVTILLPREAGKKYEFTRWTDKADETYPITISAMGEEALNGKPAFHFHETGKKYEKDEIGDVIISDVENNLWFDGRKLVRMASADGFMLDTGADPKRTPITREAIEKRDNAVNTTAGFFLAANEKDKELLGALLNEERIVRKSLDENEQTKDLSDEEKDAAAKMYAPMVLDQVLNSGGEKTADDITREKAVTKLLLTTENFETEEKDGVTYVRFNEEARKFIGNLSFALAKDAEGKWEIIEIISGGAAQTPEEQRQAVADQMKAAVEALDGEAAKVLFHKDEHANVEKRIVKEFEELKAEGYKVTCQVPTIEEKDGKFFATFVMTVEAKDGSKEEDTKTLSLIEKDGKWHLSFGK